MMAFFKKKELLIMMVVLGLIAALVYVQRPVVLKLGIFTGGSWNVPSVTTYEFVDEIIERFEQEHPGVQVEYEAGIRRQDYPTWMADRILTGNCPDVFLILDEDFFQYAQLGVLKNLNSYLVSDPQFDPSRYFPGALEHGCFDSKQFVLPLESSPELMFVNVSMLKQEGIPLPDENWTVDDLYAICEAVTKDIDHNGTVDQFGIVGYNWNHILTAYGITINDKDGKIKLDHPQLRNALQQLKDLDALNKTITPTQQDLDEGNVAFAPMDYAQFVTYNPYPWRIKRYSNFDWLCIPMPSQEAGKSSYGGAWLSMGISSRTHYGNLSWQLLKEFCYREESQKKMVLNGSGVSALQGLLFEDEIIDYYSGIDISSSLINTIMQKGPHNSIMLDDDRQTFLDVQIKKILDEEDELDLSLMELERKINKQ